MMGCLTGLECPIKATNSSEGIGKEGEGVGWLFMSECFDCIDVNDGDDMVEYLWVRRRSKANKADIVVEIC